MTRKERERRMLRIILRMNSEEASQVTDLDRLVTFDGAKQIIRKHLKELKENGNH